MRCTPQRTHPGSSSLFSRCEWVGNVNSATLCAMKNRHVLAVACSLALAWSTAALAQLAPANDMGVALGHLHLAVKDVEANKQFFTAMLGGKLVNNGPLVLI